jgi:superfamily I DNA/RNA helicase
MTDPKVRTVRIGLDYRAVVIHPPRGDVYLCVWVAHHDEAMAWAQNKRFEVNPRVGSLQVFTVRDGGEQIAESAPEPQSERVAEGRLFAGHATDDLLICGVPESLLPSVIALRTDADLDELAPYLPTDASDLLYLLAAGETFEEALAQIERPILPPVAVDTEDFAVALEKPESKQQFLLVEDDEVLAAMLNEPLEQWRVFLHPSQRRIVETKAKGPMKVLGGAGTGKTVVLMHRAALLAQRYADTDERILITTFTANLALDIRKNLKELCPGQLSRFEVTHLHGWAARFLKQEGTTTELARSHEQDRFWDEALEADTASRPLAFFKEEFAQVVQAQGITDKRGYLRASRAGRGTPLGRKQRGEVWPVLAEYRRLLQAAGRIEIADLIDEARRYLEKRPGRASYRAVLADEIQDFGPAELRLLRAMVRRDDDDLFLVGDAHQRIYRRIARLSHCGIEARGRRSRRLRLNYRTTESIKNWAVGLLHGETIDNLDGGQDTLNGYRSLRDGAPPEFAHFKDAGAEGRFVVKQIKAWLAAEVPGEHICLAVRKGVLMDRYEALLTQAGVATTRLNKNEPPKDGAVRIATMHRLKGLEFPNLLLASVQEGVVPLQLPSHLLGDEASRQDHLKSERCLAYVAATRARDALVVCGFGTPSPFSAG